MLHKLALVFIGLFALFSNLGFAQQTYIKVGEAQAKKSQLAFPLMNNVGTTKSASAIKGATEVYNSTKKNLELSSYFNIMPLEGFLENTSELSVKPKPESNGFFI